MGETIDARIAFLQRQLHAINLALPQARANEDIEALARLRDLWNQITAEVEALKVEAHNKQAPSALLVTLDRFGDEVAAVGRDLGAATIGAVKGVSTIIRYLPAILLIGALIVGLVYLGKLRKDLE